MRSTSLSKRARSKKLYIFPIWNLKFYVVHLEKAWVLIWVNRIRFPVCLLCKSHLNKHINTNYIWTITHDNCIAVRQRHDKSRKTRMSLYWTKEEYIRSRQSVSEFSTRAKRKKLYIFAIWNLKFVVHLVLHLTWLTHLIWVNQIPCLSLEQEPLKYK